MEAFTAERFTRMALGEKAGLDAISKSLRMSKTLVHPLLQERLNHHLYASSKGILVKGNTFSYTANATGFSGSKLMNYALQSFYDQESIPGREERILRIKTSAKTQSEMIEGSSLREETVAQISSLRSEEEIVVPLSRLIIHDLGQTTYNDLISNGINSSFSRSVSRFLAVNGYAFPVDRFLTVEDRAKESTPSLVMKVKYYPSRDDNRAYCTDYDALRSLTGCCLHRLLCPKSMDMRKRLFSNTILHYESKDVLDINLLDHEGENNVTFLVIGDVSNFTGSFGNAWLMLFCMMLDVSKGLKMKHNLFGIGRTIISATWLEILSTYLYLTVGVPCIVEQWNSHAHLNGGFLGVAGNITSSLLMFAIILQQLCFELESVTFDVKAHAGGDDFAIAFCCYEGVEQEIIETVREAITNYVGQLKELKVFDLTNRLDGIIEGATFCRKRVGMRRSNGFLELKGELAVPIPECILPAHPKLNKFEAIMAWRELDSNLCDYIKRGGLYTNICDSFRKMFLVKYPFLRAERVSSTKLWRNRVPLFEIGDYLVSESAFSLIMSVKELTTTHFILFHTFDAKLSQALASDFVQMRELQINGIERRLLLSAEESSKEVTVKREATGIDLNEDVDFLMLLN